MTRGPTLWPAGITHQASPARRAARAAPASVTPGTPLVATQLPPVRWPQATGLALWCLGLVRARSGGRTAGSGFGASRPQRQENTVRQQLREWCYAAPAKRGPQRQALAVAAGWSPVLRWARSPGCHPWCRTASQTRGLTPPAPAPPAPGGPGAAPPGSRPVVAGTGRARWFPPAARGRQTPAN